MNLEIGKVIKKLRTGKGIKQEELAEYVGVSFQAVSKWENGVTMPDITLLPKLAIFFGVTIDELFSIVDTDHYERIDYMLEHEHDISDENFIYTKRFLDARLKENSEDVEALRRYAKLYLHRYQRTALLAGVMLERLIYAAPFAYDTHYKTINAIEDLVRLRGTDERLVKFLEEFSAKFPTQEKAKEKLVDLYLAKRYFAKAKVLIDDLCSLWSENLQYNLFRGDYILITEGNEAKAREIWIESADLAMQREIPSNAAFWQVGERFEKICDYDMAEKYYIIDYEIHSDKKPRYLSALYSLAFMYNNTGKYLKSLETWELISEILRDDWDISEGSQADWPKKEIAKLKSIIENE